MKNAYLKTGLFVTLLISVSGCSQGPQALAAERPQAGISGHLYGADGKPMQYAKVFVTPLKGDRIAGKQTFSVGADGSFFIDLAKHQRYQLSYVGVGHMQSQLIVDYAGQKNLAMDIELDRVPYVAQSEKVQLKVFRQKDNAAKGKSKPEVIAMTQIDKGHYKASVPLAAGQIKYSLSGLTLQKWSVENPNARQFEYYRNGHFYALADHKGGDWTLDLKLPSYQKFKADNPLTLSGDWQQQTGAIQLQSRFNRMLNQQNEDRAVSKAPKFINHAGIKQLEVWRDRYPQKDLQQLIAVMSTTMWGQSKALYQQVLEEVDPQGWYWNIPRATFAHSVYRSGKVVEEKREYNTVLLKQAKIYHSQVEQFLAGNDNDGERAKLLAYLADAYRWSGDNDNYLAYYERFKSGFSHVRSFDYFNKTLMPSKVPVGSSAPDFSIADISQPAIKHSKASLKGKVYLLDFWATWCAPCIKEMPILHETYEQFHDKGFEILSLSADEVALDVANFRKGKWSMPWKHGFLDNGKNPIKDDYFVFGYPMAFLIDENGNVLANGDDVRGEKLVKTLTGYFAANRQL